MAVCETHGCHHRHQRLPVHISAEQEAERRGWKQGRLQTSRLAPLKSLPTLKRSHSFPTACHQLEPEHSYRRAMGGILYQNLPFVYEVHSGKS